MMQIDIERLVPAFLLRDRNGYALAKAIEAGLQIAAGCIEEGLKVLHDPYSMPEWRLDELAWEWNGLWYDYEADIESKRAQILAAQAFSERLGTPQAVQEMIAAVYGAGWLEEWWEYGGEPYHFAIYTTNQSALLENRAKFLKLLGMVKNVRSVLDNIYYCGAKGTAQVNAGTQLVSAMGRMTSTAI